MNRPTLSPGARKPAFFPLRAVLTAGGVAWGTFALATLLAFGTGLQKELLRSML